HRDAAQASADDRLEMLRLALGTDPRYSIDEGELALSEPTYTVNTLGRLRSELGTSVPLVFLMGADQLLALDTWREWRKLFDLAHFGVAERPGYPVKAEAMSKALAAEFAGRRADPAALASRPAGTIALFPMRPTDLSSTAVRE